MYKTQGSSIKWFKILDRGMKLEFKLKNFISCYDIQYYKTKLDIVGEGREVGLAGYKKINLGRGL